MDEKILEEIKEKHMRADSTISLFFNSNTSIGVALSVLAHSTSAQDEETRRLGFIKSINARC